MMKRAFKTTWDRKAAANAVREKYRHLPNGAERQRLCEIEREIINTPVSDASGKR